jgi:hypothetical protein
MKILYVEDEISKDPYRITFLFSSLLSKTDVKKIRDAISDPSGYGISAEEVKILLEKTGFIDFEYKFPDALARVLNNPLQYTYFVIDRNLTDDELYELDEVREVDPGYNEKLYDKYLTREGDYLLLKALQNKITISDAFYFLTAYSADEDIRGSTDLETQIDINSFRKENIIEKANQNALEDLKSIIEEHEDTVIIKGNLRYINIINKHFGEIPKENFIKILKGIDQEKEISSNLTEIRKLYEDQIKKCAELFPNMRNECSSDEGHLEKGWKATDWLWKNRLLGKEYANLFVSIWNISGKFGPHPEKDLPTIDVVYSLLYTLKTMLLWFEDIMKSKKGK